MIEKQAAFGWHNNLIISNETVELIITLDVGPRIISYRLLSGENVFHVDQTQLGGAGEETFQLRGGHRLWVAPESGATYFADNQPVMFHVIDDYSAALTSPPETGNRLEKSLQITMAPVDSRVTVRHTITALADLDRPVAAWALSVMRGGGVARIPMNPLSQHPDETESTSSPADYLPNRHLALWRYTDPKDKRFDWQHESLMIHQQGAPATKIGFLHRLGDVAYQLEDGLFTKSVPLANDANYPDGGCNLEVFTNSEMLELETLSPLTLLKEGDQIIHEEVWRLQ